jgi:hypothetical protein
MTIMLIAIPSLVVVFALIFALVGVKHSPPQAYYLKKERGATVALGEYKADPDWRAIREEGRL